MAVKTEQIVFQQKHLKPNETTEVKTIILEKSISPKKYKHYNVSLSLSKNGKEWQLYRIYQPEKE